MADAPERWECPNCSTPLNIAALGIYAKVACPVCGHIDHVHTCFANFRIESMLGLGGMSVVLRARDLVLERPLAIKLLNEFYRDQPERIARFEQECELMAKVRHKNVVSLYSAGRVKGQFYIAMELIDGRNLEEIVREDGILEPARALDILTQVVHGLEAAHKAGLLHRDMKPANILICKDGCAKVLDFGLSHGKRDSESEEIIWATPFYVPPETLMREPEDERTDIYALGMTLRHLLTGQQNFDPAPDGIEEMLACKKALPRMADVSRNLPEAYCDLIDHMTAFSAENRPENYASLLEEIAEVRVTLGVRGEEQGFLERLRRRLPLLAGGLASLCIGAGLAALMYHLATPEPKRLYIKPPTKMEWRERDLLADAMKQLSDGKTHEAAALLAQLAESEGEPAACAWASVHADVLASLHGDGVAAHNRFRAHLIRHLGRQPAPAGQGMHEQMAAMLVPQSQSPPANDFLQAAFSLRRAEEASRDYRVQETAQHLQTALSALRKAGKTYEHMVTLLSQYSKSQMESLPIRLEQQFRLNLSHLDIAAAQRLFELRESNAADDPARARLAVQKEALTLFAEAVEMMRRRSLMPPSGEALTPESLRKLLTPLDDHRLATELATLMLVAMGDMKEAAVLNPHALNPDTTEPFAVLMRDWLSRSGKPQ